MRNSGQTRQETSEQNEHDMTDSKRDTIDSKRHQETPEQDEHDMTDIEPQVRAALSSTISENEHSLLQKFRSKVDKIESKVCPICNERIPLMVLIKGMMCHRCHTEKNSPK